MYKIYSRKRFIIFSPNKSKLDPKKQIYLRKYIKTGSIIFVALFVMNMILNYMSPIYEAMCEEKAKSIATIITNEQSTVVMKNYKYEEMYSIEKDDDGKILMIRANITPINEIMSDIALLIQKEFDKLSKEKINIPLGSFSGSYLLSGIGPSVPISISLMGSIDTDMKSEFIAKGINQTLHRVYLEINCKVMILTPAKNIQRDVTNQVLLGEHVIVGEIPSSFYNFEGMTDASESLNFVE